MQEEEFMNGIKSVVSQNLLTLKIGKMVIIVVIIVIFQEKQLLTLSHI